ncbi:dehydrogenase/reductase [Longimycelium tulufanense]|uniref:Dehydrogenase/reductase n=1 Tax=Longimycelium tulufanense TaxID=907463 RepID=A0A8J3FWU0_9PSEU|nr:FAD/NAD(P)-binding oxidoreductase [Longimycelium tulufanense]GGM74318.1 dehydrogenase/reductase [Longimycelium tulufanense]
MARTIVVLGAGIGGLSVARELQNHVDPADHITLVDRNDTHTQGLSLLWLLRGWRQPDDITVAPTRDALGRARRVTATVEELDLCQRLVRTDQGALDYDALVVALGAQLNTAAVPGLDDAMAAGNAVHYYTPDAAAAAHDALRRTRSGRTVFLVTSVPYKCPAAPYEGAMLAADLLTETGARDNVTIDVYTPEPQPMPVAGPTVGQSVVSMLTTAGIGFHSGHQVERIDATAREIVFADSTRAPFDLLVFVPPHRPSAPAAATGLSPQGWIPVDPHTLTAPAQAVWALGDIASITLPNGKPLPKAAVFAKGQARTVAAGVARHLGYDAPEPHFDGQGHCYLEVGNHQAALGAGDFYHSNGPQIVLSPPSLDLHHAKEHEETEWRAAWNSAPPRTN